MVMSSHHVRLEVEAALKQASFLPVVVKHYRVRRSGFTVTDMLTGEVRVTYHSKGARDWGRAKEMLKAYQQRVEYAVGAERRVELVENHQTDELYLSLIRK
jgi:hypothetical protein